VCKEPAEGGDLTERAHFGMQREVRISTNANRDSIKRKGGVTMCPSLFSSRKWIAILVVVGFSLFLGLSQTLAQQDTKSSQQVLQGVDKMMEGKKALMQALTKQKLEKDPKLANGIKMLNEGEKLAMTGKNLMKGKAEKGKIKGKEEIMKGTTDMMQGKDAIMNELKARGMMQEGKLKGDEKMIQQGEMKMLEGKNLMMDGFKNITTE
jgi:hypothetical protein